MTIQETYQKEIIPKLKTDLGITNPMAIPRLMKIVVNCGIGREALADKKVIEKVAAQLAVITGQKPSVTRAKRAISTFKLRAGDAVGLKVTLRGRFMSDFFTRLVTIALPRVRDFRGVSASGFDGHGNYTLGISDQTIFAELEYTLIDKTRGFEVTFVTRSGSDTHAKKLLTYLGMPFEK
ncbi:MAG: 50S ribosomal protein L5 [Candidatus Gottesmanbacteria bacterium]|nr:50S ribosomal protein L5 [Candidatus Gottesmanbacteria bacterium]